MEILGLVLTGEPFADNGAAIQRHGCVRILARLPHALRIDSGRIAAWARLIPPLEDCLA